MEETTQQMTLESTISFETNSDCFEDSDDDLILEDDSTEPQTLSFLQTRLDQYLTASQLGRLAYKAGDIQLATDRFNLALDIELQVELESFNDFGVTGQLLREELQKRKLSTGNKQTPSYNKVLEKMQTMYEHADIACALDPTESKWYLQMGGALCVINEWDKATTIYEEGLCYCPQDTLLKAASNRLTKLKDMLKLLDNKVDCKTPTGSPKTHRRQSAIDTDSISSIGSAATITTTVPRSNSFTLNQGGVVKRDKRSTLSPLARKSLMSESGGSMTLTPRTKKRGSIFKMFRKSKSPMSFDDFQMSWSSDDLFSQAKQARERTAWKDLFDPKDYTSQLHESDLGSRTIENMRAINALTEL